MGAYSYALLNLHYGVVFWIALPLGGILALIFGVILGYPVLRLRGDYLAIVTLGFGEIIRLVLENWNAFSFGPSGIANIPKPPLFGIDLSLSGTTIFLFYIIDSLDISIRKGEIAALIGPNGAGKTTFFNCITGIYKPTSGDVLISPDQGQERINGLKPNIVTKKGLARTFQNIRLFTSMTVLENVMIGCHPVFHLMILLKKASVRSLRKDGYFRIFQLLKTLIWVLFKR